MPNHDTVPIPCLGCNRTVRYPRNIARARLRRGEMLVVFCSSKCNAQYVAREGTRQLEKREDLYAG